VISDKTLKYHDDKRDMSLKVREDTEKILGAIDLDEVLNNPKEYLTMLGNVWMDKHSPTFKKAFELGREHGKELSGN
jgi:hypothetical protein